MGADSESDLTLDDEAVDLGELGALPRDLLAESHVDLRKKAMDQDSGVARTAASTWTAA